MAAERRSARELLTELNQLDEHERIEAKLARDVGKSLLETVCAFANEPRLEGGWILLGVTPEELALFPSYEVHGLDHPDRVASDLASQCASAFNRPIRPEISTEQLNGKAVIVAFVPEAPAHDKPIYFKNQGLPRGAFRRIGSSDQRCTEDDLVALYQGHQQESFDSGMLADTTRADISDEALADYRKTRAEANPDAEELGWSDDDLLQSLGCLKRDSKNQWRPTVAGLVLFGTPMALRRCFPMTRVDYIRVPGREWIPDPDKRFDTVELRDPLFRLIRRAQSTVLDDLPKGFELQEGALQRVDKPAIPLRALREALVNALMHRSYRDHGPVQIIRYANRLEIRNPGFSLKSTEHLGEPGSAPRNPRIAAVLHETRFAETKGSGIRVMREMLEGAGLAPPLFESDRGRDQFIVRLFFHHFLGPEDIRWLAQFKEHQLSEAETRALIVVREAGTIDNSTYRELNKVDTLQASGSLRRLRKAGLLQQQGRGSATWYAPTEKLLGGAPALGPGSLSSNPEGLSSNPEGLSSNPEGLSSNLEDPRRGALFNDLPGELAARVGALGRRQAPEQVTSIVVELCRVRSWSADELALLLGRNVTYVRNNYLRPLLHDGRLAMTNPDVPNDPEQAYRATDANEEDES